MRTAAAKIFHQSISGHSLVRLLIVSYFMALSVGFIAGTDVSVLAAPIFPAPFDHILTSAIVFSLALMILIGRQRRLAALVLAVMLFWASYVIMLSNSLAHDLDAFWRDLALIGALILTYSGNETINETSSETDDAAMFQHLASASETTDLDGLQSSHNEGFEPVANQTTARRKSIKNQFREDFDMVRIS
ncbi:MAG: hypothetical protein GKR98_04830 [Boseongicola sp.]|nr:MAG: hypothetical protein GKR98_04830 [Boseongicola sp.]